MQRPSRLLSSLKISGRYDKTYRILFGLTYRHRTTVQNSAPRFLAMVWPVLLFRHYVNGNCFTIATDHDALKRILNLTNSTARISQWRLGLSDFDFDVAHRAGTKHKAAYALLQLNTTEKDESALKDDLPLYTTDSSKILPDSVYVVAHEESRIRSIPNT